MNWLPLILAGLAGLAMSLVNYLVLRAMLKNKRVAGVSFVRTLITAAFFVVLYFVAVLLDLELVPFLVAGAVGATVGLVVFSALLAKKP